MNRFLNRLLLVSFGAIFIILVLYSQNLKKGHTSSSTINSITLNNNDPIVEDRTEQVSQLNTTQLPVGNLAVDTFEIQTIMTRISLWQMMLLILSPIVSGCLLTTYSKYNTKRIIATLCKIGTVLCILGIIEIVILYSSVLLKNFILVSIASIVIILVVRSRGLIAKALSFFYLLFEV